MTRGKRNAVTHVLSHSAWNGLCYAGAQGINFLMQLLLVYWIGRDHFGHIGIAQICVAAIIFISELGTPNYFIREVSIREDWHQQWRRACMVRGGFSLCAIGALVVFWYVYYPRETLGLNHILFAIPAILFSTLNPTPLLIAQGKATTAARGLLVLWGVYAVVAIPAIIWLPYTLVDAGLGAALSIGFGVFIFFLWRHVAWDKTQLNAAPKDEDMLKRSLTIWVPSLIGTLYVLLLTFLIQRLTPEILAYCIIGNQIMQGISGVNLQMQRVILATLSRAHHGAIEGDAQRSLGYDLFRLFVYLLVAMMLFFYAAILALGITLPLPVVLAHATIICLLLAEWLLTFLGSFLVNNLTAQRREHQIYRVLIPTYLISMVGQLALALAWGDILLVLYVRIATSILQFALFYRFLRYGLKPFTILGFVLLLVFNCIPLNGHAIVLVVAANAVLATVLCVQAIRHFMRMIVAARTTA